MAKCANCDLSAAYRIGDPGAEPVDFCASHVPEHLGSRVAAGAFTIGDDVTLTDPAGDGKNSAAKLEKAAARALGKVEGEGAAAQVESAPVTQKRDTDDNKVAILSASDGAEKLASGSSVPAKDEKRK